MSKTPGGPCHRPWGKVGTFEKHVASFLFPTPLLSPPMTPAMATGSTAVGDKQHRLVHLDLPPIEQRHGLACLTVTDHDAARQPIKVEGMHGLTQFEQNVVWSRRPRGRWGGVPNGGGVRASTGAFAHRCRLSSMNPAQGTWGSRPRIRDPRHRTPRPSPREPRRCSAR